MKRIGWLLCALLLSIGAAAVEITDDGPAPVKMAIPPAAIATQAEGELETYDLTFPEEMPLAARNFVCLARREFEQNGNVRLPKNNDYTHWYYHDERKIGWCSVFQLYCAYHSGMQLVRRGQDVQLADDAVFSAMEGNVSNVYRAFEEHGRWLSGETGGVPKPGYLVIYGVRASTPYTHIAIVESVMPLGDGVYELTTVEGNLNSTIRRLNFRYDAEPKRMYYNMFTIPKAEITRENCQYKLQKEDWYITGFCATW